MTIGWPALCIAVFAYANPTPFLLATPHIREAAIAGGQAIRVLGLPRWTLNELRRGRVLGSSSG